MLPIEEIEKKIGYTFQNKALLEQAFVRRGYSAERGGQNNEVLEFIGDAVLYSAVTRLMMERFGTVAEDADAPKYFCTKYNEGEFTEMRKDLVQKAALSKAMDALGFHAYLVMGKGETEENVQNEASVKADLFEAVLGAVALDCDWDMGVLTKVVLNTTDFADYFTHAKEHLLRLWKARLIEAIGEPKEITAVTKLNELMQKGLIKEVLYAFRQEQDGWRCDCVVQETGYSFPAVADSKSKAKGAAAYAALRAVVFLAKKG